MSDDTAPDETVPDETSPEEVVSSDALQAWLDEPHGAIRDKVRHLLATEDFAPPGLLAKEEHRELVMQWAKKLAEQGGPALGFPSEYGGGDDLGGMIAAFETMGHADLSLLVKVGVQFGLFGGAILHLGSRHHHDAYLADVLSLELPGCFAMTETGHGSDVQRIGTTATYIPEDDQFEIHTPNDAARKDYIGNAAVHGQSAAVFAQLIVDGTNHGVHCLVAPIRSKKGKVLDGIRIEDCGDKLGLQGVDNGRIWFDHVRVPRTALLNQYADVTEDGVYESPIDNPNRRFFTMLGTLVQGRVSVGGAAISASKSALNIAIRYGLRRRQFGPDDADEEILLLDYRMHQKRLLPLLAKTVALHAAQRDLVAKLHEAFSSDALSLGEPSQAEGAEQGHRELESLAAGLKAISTWHATTTIQTCREACGGAGYMYENRFASLKADTDVFTTFEGDNHVLLQLVIKGRLTQYRDQFEEMDALGMVRFVADQAVDTVVEKTFLRAMAQAVQDLALDDKKTVRDPEYQLELFQAREGYLVHSLARRLKKGMDRDIDPFEVFNAVQDHLVMAARAHVNRKVLESFQAQIAKTEDASLVPVLERMSALYALSTLQEHRGWFLTHGRMSAARAKAIVEAVNDLCLELRPHAEAIVDAFAIPSQWVDAPLLETA